MAIALLNLGLARAFFLRCFDFFTFNLLAPAQLLFFDAADSVQLVQQWIGRPVWVRWHARTALFAAPARLLLLHGPLLGRCQDVVAQLPAARFVPGPVVSG